MIGRDAIVDLLKAAAAAAPYPLLGPRSAEEYAGKIVANAEIVGISNRGETAGFLAIYCNRPDAGFAYVAMICVDPVAGRRGIGRALLAAGVSLAGARGFPRVRLHVDPRNSAALALYRSAGFAEMARESDGRLLLERTSMSGRDASLHGE